MIRQKPCMLRRTRSVFVQKGKTEIPLRRSTVDATKKDACTPRATLLNKEVEKLISFQQNIKIFDVRFYDNSSKKMTRSRMMSLLKTPEKVSLTNPQKLKLNIQVAKQKVVKPLVKKPKPATIQQTCHVPSLSPIRRSPSPLQTKEEAGDFDSALTLLRVGAAAKSVATQEKVEKQAYVFMNFPHAFTFVPVFLGISFVKLTANTGVVHLNPFSIRKISNTKLCYVNFFMVSGSMIIDVYYESSVESVKLSPFCFLQLSPLVSYQMKNETNSDAVCLFYS